MKYFTNKNSSSSAFTNIYKTESLEELHQAVDTALKSYGYKREEPAQELTYVKGSRIKRLLFGAFAKYFKYKVIILPEGEGHFSVLISSISSGVSGGIIGVTQISKETKKLNALLQSI